MSLIFLLGFTFHVLDLLVESQRAANAAARLEIECLVFLDMTLEDVPDEHEKRAIALD